MGQKTLPSMRIKDATWEIMQRALNKVNQTQIKPLSMTDLRRLSFIFCCEAILKGEQLNIRFDVLEGGKK